ncbi:unnamed protein product [Brassica oleracea var. botrytis]|uniref:Endonuclease/exonuclease/phosphatase domain-containing protein n=2 Tax=Brassica oleracea TaxID=3712 RepID=A0A0D3AYW6_BRAOL|nr:unnamed protein product [Brassica oleracea]
MTVDSDPSLVPVSVVTGDPSAVLPEGPVVTLPDPLLPLIPPPSLSPLITPSVASLNDDVVYAGNTVEERNDLLIELIEIQASLSLESNPWLLRGDFNEITHPEEHSSPAASQISCPMIEFNTCLNQLEVCDLRYHGEKFTWSNKQPDIPIAKKLDRALINEHWLNTYPRSLAKFLAPEFSDHTPCCIELDCPTPLAGSKPFKFFNYLTLHPDFLTLVEEAWTCTENENHSLSLLSVKQKELKRVLKQLNKDNFSDIQKRVLEANSLFTDAHVLSLRQPTSDHFATEKELHEKLLFLKKVEEEYYKQLSRINWLKCGDSNTSYFHKVAKARKAFNAIIILISTTGIEATSPQDIGNLAVAHFLSILGPPTPQTTPVMIDSVAGMIRTNRFSCSPEQAQVSLGCLPLKT